MTTVTIPDKLAHLLAERARAAGSDTDTFIREALIEKLEDMEDVELAEKRFAAGLTPIPIEEVIRNLGLED